MKKLTALAALILTVALTAAACGQTAAPTETTASSAADTAVSSADTTTVSRENLPDSLPSLDYNGESINISYFGTDASAYDSVGKGELTGDVVYDAVYNRNSKVSDRLNVAFNWYPGSGDWDGYPSAISKLLLAGDTSYDIVFMENSRLFQQSLEGYYYDLIGAQYLDYSQPWWYVGLMDESGIDSSRRFFVSGAFSITTLSGASVMFFNRGLFNSNIGDPAQLYTTVTDGAWTYDKLMEYCSKLYLDLNGNGAPDFGDQFGFAFQQAHLNYISMSCGYTFVSRDADGLPVLELGSEEAINWSEKLFALLYTDNYGIFDENSKYNGFSKGETVFSFGMLGSLSGLRDSTFDYGILPYPKYSESLDYLCGAATANGEGAAIPVTASADKEAACCAVLEALSAESYRSVIPAWYDTALKTKYVSTDVDSQMIDLIYSHINSPFIMMADKTIGTGSVFMASLYKSSNAGAYASYYAKNESKFTKKLADIIAQYKALGA